MQELLEKLDTQTERIYPSNFNLNKLHKALRQATADLEACAADPKYHVSMDTFHVPDSNSYFFGLLKTSVCHVCLAGAVMAKSYKTSPTETDSPLNYPKEISNMFNALDALRNGNIGLALRRVHQDDVTAEEMYKASQIRTSIHLMRYETDPEFYIAELKILADRLEVADL